MNPCYIVSYEYFLGDVWRKGTVNLPLRPSSLEVSSVTNAVSTQIKNTIIKKQLDTQELSKMMALHGQLSKDISSYPKIFIS